VEFREDNLLMAQSVSVVRLHMTQYVTGKSDMLEMKKRSKKPMFRNYVKVMKKLLDANKEPKKFGLWLSLHVWMVMSGVMFLRTPYGVAWSVEKDIKDIHGMGKYAWVKAIWHVHVEAVEEMQRKFKGYVSNVYMNGFSLLIYVKFR